MLVSRFISRLLTLRPVSTFATSPSSSTTLHNKAISARTLSEFTQLVNQNRQEFTADVFAAVSRHVGGLINSRDKINFDEAKELLKLIESVDKTTLSERNAISLLSILRNLRTRGFNSANFISVKNFLAGKYLSQLQKRESKEEDLGDLVNAFIEFTYLYLKEKKLITDRLISLLEENNQKKGKLGLTESQIGYLAWGLSMKSELNYYQAKLRSLLLQQVGKQLQSFKMQDLVRVAVNLNRMDLFDLDNQELSIMRQIADRILNSITELQEKTIYELIRTQNVGRLPGIYRIYEEVNRNIFAEIDESGESQINSESIFKVLTHLADKVPLSKVTEAQKKKFFAFIENYARFCKQDESRSKLMSHKLRDLVQKDYFAGEQKKILMKLLDNHRIKLNAYILYDLAVRDFDITPFANDILQYAVDNQRDQFQVKLSIIAHRLIKLGAGPQFTAYFEALKAKIEDQLSTPQKFMKYYLRLLRFDLKLSDFHEVFGELIQKLPNPLENTIDTPNYRKTYIQYMHDATRGREYSQFFSKYESAITIQQLANVITHHVSKDPREIQPKRQVVQLLNKRVYDIIESKGKNQVQALIQFARVYSRFVIGGQLDANSINSIFRIIHCLIGKIDTIIELNLQGHFFSTLDKYLSKNHRNYSMEHNYRQLIKHLASYIDKIQDQKNYLVNIVVKEGLRLNVLTKKNLENVAIDKLNLSFFDKSRVLYVADSTYVPAIEKVTYNSLQVILSNHNLENVLVEQEKCIIQVLQNTYPQDIAYFLTIYNHTKSPASKRILAEMLNIVVAKLNYFQRVDITGIINNALDRGYFIFTQYHKLTEKLIEHFKNRAYLWSIETHLELIRFIISQPSLNPKDYYSELVAFAEKRDDISETIFEQILLKLANTNYRFRDSDLKYVDKIIKKNPHTGLFFFTMVEPLLEAQARSASVKLFVEKFNQNQQKKEQTLSRVHYLYIKKQYPAQTADLNLDEKALYYENFLGKPKNQEIINTIVKSAGGKSQQLSILGPDNYVLKIKDTVLTFLHSKRVGSYYEHEYLKRVISALLPEQVNIVNLHGSNHPSSILEYINKKSPKLFDQTEYQIALSELKSNSRKRSNETAEN